MATQYDPDTLNSYMGYYEEWAGLPAGTLSTIAQIESSYDPSSGNFNNVCNRVRACGLMQLRPIALKDIYSHFRVSLDPLDAVQAIVGAAMMFYINNQYIHWWMQRYQSGEYPDVFALIAAYNGGWTAGRNLMMGYRIPRETQNYLARAQTISGGFA